jgi:SHS2 domain-containing protein
MSFDFVEDVTSDLRFVARGDSLQAVFAAAADALLAATLEEPASLRDAVRRSLDLAEPDRELLLLRFLNELIFLRDAEQLLLRARHVEVSTDGGAQLSAELGGEPIDRRRHRLLADVKAATAHGLYVRGEGSRWEAQVTLDV